MITTLVGIILILLTFIIIAVLTIYELQEEIKDMTDWRDEEL